MILTYQYRLLPSKAQHRALESLAESQRVLYNAALEERISAYRHRVSLTYFDQTRTLTEWRGCDAEAGAVPSNLQRGTLKRLDEAYKAFFRRSAEKDGKAGFPRFKGRRGWDSFSFAEFKGISLTNGRLRFKGMPGALRVHLHRALPTPLKVRSCVFKHDAKGWKVGFAVEVQAARQRESSKIVGLDLGIINFAVLSDGSVIPSLRAARRAERSLRVAQRSLARKARRSSGRRDARNRLARCHARIVHARLNYLHQVSAWLVKQYDVIVIEKLNVRALARGMLARDVQDASWSKFISILSYKAEKAGTQVVSVDAKNTSQDCSGCGISVPKSLNDRHHCCGCCGLSIDRDLNAARNVLNRAGVGPSLPNVAGCGTRASTYLEKPWTAPPLTAH